MNCTIKWNLYVHRRKCRWRHHTHWKSISLILITTGIWVMQGINCMMQKTYFFCCSWSLNFICERFVFNGTPFEERQTALKRSQWWSEETRRFCAPRAGAMFRVAGGAACTLYAHTHTPSPSSYVLVHCAYECYDCQLMRSTTILYSCIFYNLN